MDQRTQRKKRFKLSRMTRRMLLLIMGILIGYPSTAITLFYENGGRWMISPNFRYVVIVGDAHDADNGCMDWGYAVVKNIWNPFCKEGKVEVTGLFPGITDVSWINRHTIQICYEAYEGNYFVKQPDSWNGIRIVYAGYFDHG